ncbi:MAG: hypothetical protein IKO68_11380 [Oscillospiraceae bacterium]|nr:hypothetical protein [Oscillospiraceae bacterium]
MLDVPSAAKTLADVLVGIPGAGRRTLLAALKGLCGLRFPDNFRLCVLDAERMDAPAQIALLDELAADPLLDLIFVLNKADRITGPRTVMTRTLALLRERGFPRAVLYPVCARAAMLFGLSTEQIAGEELMSELGSLYFRYSPGEQSLSAFAATREGSVCLGSREVTPEQLRLAQENTGVPALAGAVAAMAEEPEPREQGTGNREQGTGNREQGTGNREPGTGNREQGTGNDTPASDETEAGVPEAPLASDDTPASDETEAGVPEAPLASDDTPASDDAEAGVPDAPLASDDTPASDDAEAGAPEAPLPSDDTPVPDEAEAGGAPEAPSASDEAPASDEAAASDEPAADGVPAEAPAPDGAPLADLLAEAEGADCATLLELAKRVKADPETPDELREQALDRLHEAYLARETEELELLSAQAEELELPALRALADRIAAGPYTVVKRTPYLTALNARIDRLQADELAALCAGTEEADARTLARIREQLERVDCAEVLKTEHFRRIDARQEALDLEALERVTAGAETMSEKELRTVALTLEASNWNPKYVGLYRHKIELCREAALYREVHDQLAELEDMERRELVELRERIESMGVPARFTVTALKRIDEKLFRQDMLRLMALRSDFNDLDFESIDELRAQAARFEACERARQHYLNYLLAREQALIIENTLARAELARQLLARHKLRADDFCFPSAPDYQRRLAEFWQGSGLEQPRDIPVFLFENGSQFALSGSRFYFKTGRHLDCVPVENVERVQVMRQHMSLLLQIVGKDNSYRLTEARISRIGSERTLEFLNDCFKAWAEPGPAGPLPANLRVRRLDPAEYTAPVETEPLSPRIAWELFCRAYDEAELRDGNLIRPEDQNALERLPKLRLSLGLPENTPVIWYASASWLGTVKEGVALGTRGLYSKEGKNPVQTVPTEEIAALRAAGSRRMSVTLLSGETLSLPISEAMTPLILDYIHALQLGSWLRNQEERP